MTASAKVFTIVAGESFSDRLVDGLLQRFGGDPLSLSRVTLLLPTRQIGRAHV